MSSGVDIAKCPHCGQESFTSDYNIRTTEEYGFCGHCGYSYSRRIKRLENGRPELILKRVLPIDRLRIVFIPRNGKDKDIVAEARMTSKEDFDIWNGYIGNPKRFEDHFPGLCQEVTEKVLANPDKYVSARDIENYHRGSFSDGSGDKYDTALWRNFSIFIVDDKHERVLYYPGDIKFVGDNVELYAVTCEETEHKGFGVVRRTHENGVIEVTGFTEEIDDETVAEILAKPDVIGLTVRRNGTIVTLR